MSPELDVGEPIDYPPFIKAGDVGSKMGAEVTAEILTPHRTIVSTGNVVVNVRVKGKKYTLGLNIGNSRRVIAKHGKDSDAWVGKRIKLIRIEARNPKLSPPNDMVPSIKVE